MEDRTPRRRRPRPVSDAPVHRLLDRGAGLGKGWLLELIEARPLERAEGLLAGGLVGSAPRICEAIVGGLRCDEQLARLQPGGALEPLLAEIGELVDAHGADEVSAALDALRGVIWSALRVESPDPDPELVWALGERLSVALEAVRAAALRGFAARSGPGGAAADPHGPEPRLEHEIALARGRGAPLALLLVELDELERLLAVEGPEWAGFGVLRDAVCAALDTGDVVADADRRRSWVIAHGRDRADARALAERIVAAVRAGPDWRGAPPAVAVGIAVLGEDADGGRGLIHAAEEARYAAGAAGVAVGPPGPS